MIDRTEPHRFERNRDIGKRTDGWHASPPHDPPGVLLPHSSAAVPRADTSSIRRAGDSVQAILSSMHQQSLAVRLAFVIGAIGAATVLTGAVRSVADETMYVFFVGAVALISWVDGLRFGLAAVMASILAVDIAFIEPVGSLRLFSEAPVAQLVSFALVAGMIAALTDALARARRKAERVAREADQAKAAAENAAATKGEFLSTLSHEVRTPINALLGYADLVAEGSAGAITPVQAEFMRRLRGAAQHLLTVVNEVLEIAKADAGRLTVDMVPVAANLVVDGAVSLVLPQAIAKHVEVVVAPSVHPIRFCGDVNRAREIVVNLLSNAVKVAPNGSAVRVDMGRGAPADVSSRLDDPSSSVWIRVTDQGPGIEESDQELIFEPFVQGGDRRAVSKTGTGLGLAISRRLSRLMRGDLVVESRVGKGASFTLWLPAAVVIVAALVTLTACGGEKKSSSSNASPVPAPTVTPSTSVGSAAGALPEPEPGIPPAGTTGQMTALGDSIFHGQAAGGTCFTCHGPDAKGTPLAPSLVDHEWLTGNGSFAFIVQRVTDGMPKPTAPYEGPMLPMGGAPLTTDQARAVAAYVASISHPKG